ncbi:hypothetical protein JCM14469_13880 [Desulfatiferula olefinivorans]
MRISTGLFLAVLWLAAGVTAAEAKRTHTVFFEGSDHELNVYRVYGKEEGKTILLIGGIQGDEPGGFLSADIYADMSLTRGNLIVVPRANFYSILLNQRQVNEDMNRKFADDSRENYETEVVSILKELIAESDCLLNLHDGSGFYAETFVDDQRNPNRYGQSIIVDCERHEVDGRKVELGDLARRVVERINREIPDPNHRFHVNNHNTFSDRSPHKVQRKSATFYALTRCGIPAFGVESSKSLPLEMKVRHHIYAINAFMDEFGVVPEVPAVNLDPPELKYLVVAVNNTLPLVVRHDQVLTIRPGDTVVVTHIEANFKRGLSADILGFGSVNDYRKPLVIDRSTRITVRKDFYPCGSVYLALDENGGGHGNCLTVSDRAGRGGSILLYRVTVNGRQRIVENYGTVRLVRGDTFSVEDVISDAFDPAGLTVNVKGFVGPSSVNTGEDRGYVIQTARDLWPKYSLDKTGRKYQVVTQDERAIIGKLFIELDAPALNYLLLKTDDRTISCFENGGRIGLDVAPGGSRSLRLVDLITNVDTDAPDDLAVRISGPDRPSVPLEPDRPFAIEDVIKDGIRRPSFDRIDVFRDGVLMGAVSINYTQEMNRDEQVEKSVDH